MENEEKMKIIQELLGNIISKAIQGSVKIYKEMDEYCYLPTEKKNEFDEMNYKIEFSTIRKYEKATDCNIGKLMNVLEKYNEYGNEEV